MPEISNPEEIQDIFSGVETPAEVVTPILLTPESAMVPQQPAEETSYVTATPLPWRRWLMIIGICLAGLLLLVVGVWAIIQWWPKTQPQTNVTTNTINTPVVNTVITVPTNTTVITNTTPTNTTTTQFVDSDHDGLSDEEELIQNTNPKKQDTDGDGLSDREEVKVYRSDPRNPDTDGDGYQDGNEVTHFYDPNNSNSRARLPGLNPE